MFTVCPKQLYPIVQGGDGDCRALVDADLEDQRLVGLSLIEGGNLLAHFECRLHRIRRFEERRHHRVADRLDDCAVVADRRLVQPAKMLLY